MGNLEKEFQCQFSLDQLMDLHEGLLSQIAATHPDYVVIEVADGLYQKETSMLLDHELFTESIDHVILSCCDSLAVSTGVQLLAPIFGSRLFALGGLFTGSPLLVAEVENRSTLPILTLEKLLDPEELLPLLVRDVNIAV